MLLGSSANKDAYSDSELLVIQLILQRRYAQVYELLADRQPATTASLYNLALCLHWSGNYREALNRLDGIQLVLNVDTGNRLNHDNDYEEIRTKQNQTDEYLNGLSEAYVKTFPALTLDAIVRLKTDCWLQIGDYTKVITIASPIAHKGYKNITDAINLAKTANDKRV